MWDKIDDSTMTTDERLFIVEASAAAEMNDPGLLIDTGMGVMGDAG